jgi:hypothetical protein
MSPLSPNRFSTILVLKLSWNFSSLLSSSCGVVTVLAGFGDCGARFLLLVQKAGSR